MVRAHEWDISRRLGPPADRRPWWAALPPEPEDALRLDVETAGARTVLSLSGELDVCTAPDLESFLGGRDLDGCAVLEIDLAGVTTMASAGLSALITVRRECELRGIDLRLRDPQSSVARVFELTGLSRLFTWGDVPDGPAVTQDAVLF
jgi:anti-sigma B factor antagonist